MSRTFPEDKESATEQPLELEFLEETDLPEVAAYETTSFDKSSSASDDVDRKIDNKELEVKEEEEECEEVEGEVEENGEEEVEAEYDEGDCEEEGYEEEEYDSDDSSCDDPQLVSKVWTALASSLNLEPTSPAAENFRPINASASRPREEDNVKKSDLDVGYLMKMQHISKLFKDLLDETSNLNELLGEAEIVMLPKKSIGAVSSPNVAKTIDISISTVDSSKENQICASDSDELVRNFKDPSIANSDNRIPEKELNAEDRSSAIEKTNNSDVTDSSTDESSTSPKAKKACTSDALLGSFKDMNASNLENRILQTQSNAEDMLPAVEKTSNSDVTDSSVESPNFHKINKACMSDALLESFQIPSTSDFELSSPQKQSNATVLSDSAKMTGQTEVTSSTVESASTQTRCMSDTLLGNFLVPGISNSEFLYLTYIPRGVEERNRLLRIVHNFLNRTSLELSAFKTWFDEVIAARFRINEAVLEIRRYVCSRSEDPKSETYLKSESAATGSVSEEKQSKTYLKSESAATGSVSEEKQSLVSPESLSREMKSIVYHLLKYLLCLIPCTVSMFALWDRRTRYDVEEKLRQCKSHIQTLKRKIDKIGEDCKKLKENYESEISVSSNLTDLLDVIREFSFKYRILLAVGDWTANQI